MKKRAMRKIATVLATALLGFGALGAAPAQACVGVQCTVDCIKRIVSGSRVCPD